MSGNNSNQFRWKNPVFPAQRMVRSTSFRFVVQYLSVDLRQLLNLSAISGFVQQTHNSLRSFQNFPLYKTESCHLPWRETPHQRTPYFKQWRRENKHSSSLSLYSRWSRLKALFSHRPLQFHTYQWLPAELFMRSRKSMSFCFVCTSNNIRLKQMWFHFGCWRITKPVEKYRRTKGIPLGKERIGGDVDVEVGAFCYVIRRLLLGVITDLTIKLKRRVQKNMNYNKVKPVTSPNFNLKAVSQSHYIRAKLETFTHVPR